MQVPVPVQPSPDHPAKSEFASGVALNVTTVPWSNVIEQVEPQSIPDGVEVTEPPPTPAFVTSRLRCGWLLKFAVTEVAASPTPRRCRCPSSHHRTTR